jgi:Transposase, Mutator family
MIETLNDVTKKKLAEVSAEEQAARELVRMAREQGLSLTGPDGLLKQLTKTVLETAVNEEMTEHLGHSKHAQPSGETGNIRSGTRAKTVPRKRRGDPGVGSTALRARMDSELWPLDSAGATGDREYGAAGVPGHDVNHRPTESPSQAPLVVKYLLY